MGHRISRSHYAELYGPTTGDRVRLADTELLAKVENDATVYGDESVFGGGKTMREGMAAGLGLTPEAVGRAPMTLIGTPEEMVAELQRRARVWDVREVVIQLQDESVAQTFAREVIPALRG